jgi:hypothetical protein
MKQTAVNWLIHILKGQQDKPFTYDEWMIAMEHAQAMELEQLEFFFKQGHLHSGCPYGLEETYKKTFTNESNT